MTKGNIVIISGPSGSGKTTLYKRLLSSQRFKGRLVKSMSVTTRSPRPGERNGRDYLFMSKNKFISERRQGHFLESQKVFDNYYGTPKSNVRALLNKGRHVLLCIDVKGARVVSRLHPQAIKIFIAAPSMRALEKRLKNRASESKRDLNLRLKTARQEMAESKRYDYIVVNKDLGKAYRQLGSILALRLGI